MVMMVMVMEVMLLLFAFWVIKGSSLMDRQLEANPTKKKMVILHAFLVTKKFDYGAREEAKPKKEEEEDGGGGGVVVACNFVLGIMKFD